MAHDVFVSYPNRDKAVADAVVHALESRGVRCWVAPRDVAMGADWAGAIIQAIDDCELMVLVFSDAANESEHILREVRAASDAGKSILPLRTAEVEPSQSLRYYLGGTHWLDAITEPVEAHIDELADRVASMVGVLDEDTGPEPATSNVAPTDSHVAVEPDEADDSWRRRVPLWARVAVGVVPVAVLVVVGAILVSSDGDDDPAMSADTSPPEQDDDGAEYVPVDDAGEASQVDDDGESPASEELVDAVADEAVIIALANGGEGGFGPNLLCSIGTIEEQCDLVGTADDSGGNDVAAADFDGDGVLDLAFAVLGNDPSDPSTPYVGLRDEVCLARGDGFDCSDLSDDELPSTAITAADLDGDADPDVVIGGFGNVGESVTVDEARACLNQGDATFTCSPLPLSESGLMEVYALPVADMDGDGKADIVVAGNGPNQLCRGDGAGGWSCSLIEQEPSETRGAVTGDFDEDGSLDVVVANWRTPNRVCFGDGAGGFECADFSSPDNPSTSVDAGDVNGDGHLDVIVGRGLSGRETDSEFADSPDFLCLGDGAGALMCSEVSVSGDLTPRGGIPISGDSTHRVALVDANGDGALDFIRLGVFNDLCFGDGDGGFTCRWVEAEYRDERGFPAIGGFTGMALIAGPAQPTSGGGVAGPAERLLISDTVGTIWSYDLSAGDLVQVAAVNAENYDIEFTPDGRLIGTDFRGAVYELDLETGAQRELVGGGLDQPVGLAPASASEDNTRFYIADRNVGVYSYDLRNDELELLFATPNDGGQALDVDAEGWVYFAEGGSRVVRFDPSVTPIDPQTIVDLPGAFIAGLAVHPNGNLYAIASNTNIDGPGAVFEIEVATGDVRVVHEGDPIDWPGGGILGPDGFLYVIDPGVPALHRLDPVSGEVEQLHVGQPFGDPVDVIIDRS